VASPRKSNTGRRSSNTAELGLVPLDGHNPGMGKAESGSGGPVFVRGSQGGRETKDVELDPLLGSTANGGNQSTAYDSASGVTVQGHGLAGSAAEKAKALWAAVTRREILLPTIFVFLYNGTPSYESALFYFEASVPCSVVGIVWRKSNACIACLSTVAAVVESSVENP
jgi:hypothetical protein